MADNPTLENNEDVSISEDQKALESRRDFLVGLKKWSAIVIGGALLGGALPTRDARAGWVNGGAGWVNGRGGGGGGSWVNRSGGGGGWVNGGGGGGGWINNRGGGGTWVNR